MNECGGSYVLVRSFLKNSADFSKK